MPPKSCADVASRALTPDSVWLPLSSFFSGGAHAARPKMRSADVVRERNRDLVITDPSGARDRTQRSNTIATLGVGRSVPGSTWRLLLRGRRRGSLGEFAHREVGGLHHQAVGDVSSMSAEVV